jgi:hypothetical protein
MMESFVRVEKVPNSIGRSTYPLVEIPSSIMLKLQISFGKAVHGDAGSPLVFNRGITV